MLDQSPKYFIYDNACHLQPFINSHNTLTNNRLEILKEKHFCIDRLHYYNHTREICKTFHCDNYQELKSVNSMSCEETNFWLSGFKYISKHMNGKKFVFYLFIICDFFNQEKLNLNRSKK